MDRSVRRPRLEPVEDEHVRLKDKYNLMIQAEKDIETWWHAAGLHRRARDFFGLF